jgi:hypothetical protein
MWGGRAPSHPAGPGGCGNVGAVPSSFDSLCFCARHVIRHDHAMSLRLLFFQRYSESSVWISKAAKVSVIRVNEQGKRHVNLLSRVLRGDEIQITDVRYDYPPPSQHKWCCEI